MPACVIAGNNMADVETMQAYAKLVVATLEPVGGKFPVRVQFKRP
jgi:uncharacterized protein (DUF1330 family)